MRPWTSLASCALVLSTLLTGTAHALIVVWNPETRVDLALSMPGVTNATGTGARLVWHPCDSGPPEVQFVGSFDLLDGIEGDFDVDMCVVHVTFQNAVTVAGTSGSPWLVELDAQSLMLNVNNPTIEPSYSVQYGSPSGAPTLFVQ